jgi:hypothetical protein
LRITTIPSPGPSRILLPFLIESEQCGRLRFRFRVRELEDPERERDLVEVVRELTRLHILRHAVEQIGYDTERRNARHGLPSGEDHDAVARAAEG